MIRTPNQTVLNTGPDLTALIDIVFIVVVFLLLTANTPLLSLPVDIPSTDSQINQAVKTKQSITISLKADAPQWHLVIEPESSDASNKEIGSAAQYYDWLAFKTALLTHTEQSPKSLLIATDRETDAELLLQLLALLNEHGLSDAQILMEPEE